MSGGFGDRYLALTAALLFVVELTNWDHRAANSASTSP
jgi:hypothetical protein